MPSFSAPFYGKINRLTVNPSDNTLWALTAHPMGRAIAPTRLDVQALLDGANTLTSTSSVHVDGVSIDILGHSTGLYVLTAQGKVFRLDNDGVAFTEVFACSEDFGLQGIVGFSDGKAEYPAKTGGGEVALIASHNRKLVLVGATAAYIVDVSDSGAFEVGATLSTFGAGEITAWAANTVFEGGSQKHNCAFGWSSGVVSAYFTDGNSNEFHTMTLMHASEVEITANNPLHKGKVSTLLYVQDTDPKGRTKRYLMSAGVDQYLYQTSLLEGIAIPRKNQHKGSITSFIAGAGADGDGSYRGTKFGRFYTLSNDGTVKAFLNEYINEQASTYKADTQMSVGVLMVLSAQHTSGVYAEGDYVGSKVPTPHLVLSNGSEIRLLFIDTTDKKDIELVSELRRNGRMADSAHTTIQHGQNFVNEMGWHAEVKTREASLERFKNWDAEWLMDSLKHIASEHKFSIAYRERALDALVRSTHPRRIVLLEGMLRNWGNTEDTQKLAYDALKSIFTDSLRPQKLVLQNGHNNRKLAVIGDLAEFARGNGPLKREALQQLQGIIKNRDYDLALRAYDNICGEGELEAVMPGVEGVLYAIFSEQRAIQNEMATRLANRGLVKDFETTLILRRLLESNDEVIRERAVDVSLLRASQVGSVLRFGDEDLHRRLYVLEHGAFKSTDDQEAMLKAALPSVEEVEHLRTLFSEEVASVQADLDVLIEFSTCTNDDVSVYALQARASFGFESAVQGLIKLSSSVNQKIARQAVIGLGYMVHLDDAFQRLRTITLAKSTPFEIGCVSIFYAVKGSVHRKQNPVLNVLNEVLDGGNPKLRETAITIGQSLLNEVVSKVQREESKDLNALNTESAPLPVDSREKESLREQLSSLRVFFERVLREETVQNNARKEAYKSFYVHNLGSEVLVSDKTETLKVLLNLRDGVLFNQALKDLCAHIQSAQDRGWALALFKQLIDQDIVLEHHSNVWSIWTTMADFAEGESFESTVLRVGFECAAACHCTRHRNGSYSICERHRIRRNAFLRVLSASGDWLAEFIRDALNNVGAKNKDLGESAAVLAVSERAKVAVARMSEPSTFILSMVTGEGERHKAQKSFGCELLLMYPKYYSDEIQKAIFQRRTDPTILGMLCDKYGSHLMTEELYAYFIKNIADGNMRFWCAGVERFAKDKGKLEELTKMLIANQDVRLVRKGIEFASANFSQWGNVFIEDVLNSDDERAKIAYTSLIVQLEKESTIRNNDAALKSFVKEFYASSSASRQIWVVESLKMDQHPSDWKKELLSEICISSKFQSVQRRGFEALNALNSQEPWVVTVLKAGLQSRHSDVVDLSFQGLLSINRLLGPIEERSFLEQMRRKDQSKENQERAIVAALTTTASWRVEFIVEALNDDDAVVRGLMCEKLKSISGLDDEFFQGLTDHQYTDVRDMAAQVLVARGVYRPKSKTQSTGSLEDAILEAPPNRPDEWDGWSAWYWKVQDWKDRKIEAVVAAGKTHRSEFYSVFQKLLLSFGYGDKRSKLWSDAVYATSWGYIDWWEFIILHTGWVLQDSEAIAYAKSEAENQTNARLRVAWNVSAMRSGQKENLLWLKQQFDASYWNNYKRYIKQEYLFEGMFAVNSSLVLEGSQKASAFPILKEAMNSDRRFANDLFRLSMLRLSQEGGPVDLIGIGYASADPATNLEAVQMRECQYSKDELLKRVVSFLNESEIPEKDPYALSNLGGGWYSVVRLTLELHLKSVNACKEVDVGYWKSIAQMLSCDHAQLRARAVNAYFRRYVYGEEKDRFQVDLENFARQLSSVTVPEQGLTQDGKPTTIEKACELAFDAYIGLIRAKKIQKNHYPIELRRDALGCVSDMCTNAAEPSKVLPVLKTALNSGESQLRFKAYSTLIALQNEEHSLIDLSQLIQMGLRSTDSRLKRMALSLIWETHQLEQAEKMSKLESILKNANDASARYAFDLLHAVAGRPAAWDKADVDKDNAYRDAESKRDLAVQALERQISIEQETFAELSKAVNQRLGNVPLSTEAKKEEREALEGRRTKLNERVAQLQAAILEAKEQYYSELMAADDSHGASMDAPLSAVDAQVWFDACARRDELVAMAIDAYFSDLRLYAVNSGLTEVARRRPYFEKQAEEFVGYYSRLLGIVEKALTSPYGDLKRHTALSMASYQLSQGHNVVLELLNSHDGSDQNAAMKALVELGPVALTSHTDKQGNALPRTALILLARSANDEFGTVNRSRLFRAIGELKDRHPSVRRQLFAYLDKGVESADYGYVLNALIDLTGCRNQILKFTDWADLTPEDFTDLQYYLPRDLNWEHVDLERFEALYQEVYDERLLADLMDNLIEHNDCDNLPRLISMAVSTKGFDVFNDDDDKRIEPINQVLLKIVERANTPLNQYVRTRAINGLMERLNNIARLRFDETEEQSGDFIATGLAAVLDANCSVIDDSVLNIAICLAKNKYGDASKNIFDVLYTVATSQIEPVYRRVKAMSALGHVGDERAVVALLNAAGMDAYGEELLVDPEAPALSSYDVRQLRDAAADGLGGMIFSQNCEGIYQFLTKMSRSNNRTSYEKGHNGLAYFLRSEQYALQTAVRFSEEYQKALNSNNAHRVAIFVRHMSKALTPHSTESHSDNAAGALTVETESLVKAYLLSTFFGETFELNGEVFNPLYVQKSVFDQDYKDASNLDAVYQVVRQWVHGARQNQGLNAERNGRDIPIDFAYLADLSAEKRTIALKTERKLFENFCAHSQYTNDVTKVMVEYLSPSELVDLAVYAYGKKFYDAESHSVNTVDRYYTVYNALMGNAETVIVDMMNGLKRDYTADINGNLVTSKYTKLALDMFEQRPDVLATHMDDFVDLVQWLKAKLDDSMALRAFGDTEEKEVRASLSRILKNLLIVSQRLPIRSGLVSVVESLLDAYNLFEGDASLKSNLYNDLFEVYLEYGQVDWNFVDRHLETSDRQLRNLVVSYVETDTSAEILSRVLGWVEDDAAALSRLVDVLKGASVEFQTQLVGQMKDAGSASAVLLVLSRLQNVAAFKTLIDSLRDENGKLTAEKGVRTVMTPRTSEKKRSPLLAETIFNSLAVMATDKAEYYLRDLSDDTTLDYPVRQAAAKAAQVAHRRRVPLHIRRVERS